MIFAVVTVMAVVVMIGGGESMVIVVMTIMVLFMNIAKVYGVGGGGGVSFLPSLPKIGLWSKNSGSYSSVVVIIVV